MGEEQRDQRYPGLRSFVSRRLNNEDAWGLHVTIGMILGVLGLSLFLLLASYAMQANHLTQLDAKISADLKEEAHSSSVLAWLFLGFTSLGELQVLAALSSIVALVLLVLLWQERIHYALAICWIMASVGAGLINVQLKDIYQRPRPDQLSALVHPGGTSFPSGHSMGSLIIYGMLAYLLILTFPRRSSRIAIVASIALLVLAIGSSRVVLGAHWPSDVVGGYLAGTVWLSVCVSAAETVRRRERAYPTSESSEAPAGLMAEEGA